MSHKNIILLFILLNLLAIQAKAAPLNIATFNLEYYGRGGNPTGQPNDEYRNPFLSEFLSEQLKEADVIVFEEVIEVEELKKLMLPMKMTCHSYEQQAVDLHQYISLCHKDQYQFVPFQKDGNFAMYEVQSGNKNLRPGLWGILKDNNNIPLLQIVGVHLKAFEEKAAFRLQQVEALTQKLQENVVSYPTMIIGDFNVYQNEKFDFEKKFGEALNLKNISYPELYSYRTITQAKSFDQAYLSNVLTASAHVKGPCNNENHLGTRFQNLDFYNRTISDHCPVLYQITF